MTTVQLTSYEAFVTPLNYHRQSALFLRHAGRDLPSRAAAVLDELRQHHPEYHAQLSDMISSLGQRLTAEGQGHEDAVGYLQSHRQFLMDREARFSGTSPITFPVLTEEVPDWLQVKHSLPHGCFDEFRSLLRTYQHDLYSADKTLRDFEDLIWKAIHNPDALRVHVDWSGNPLADGAADIVNFGADRVVNDPVELALAFVRDHEGDIRNLIDSVRRGVESVLLPLVDGEKLQDLIDYVAALHHAYQHHVSDPFTPTTHAFATSYQPPQGESSYHDSLASVSQQQAYTGEALATLLTQLQNLQTLNEQKTGGQISLITLVVVALGAMVIALAVVPIPASVGVELGDAGIMAGILAELAAIWESIAAAFVAIGAALASIPAWAWVVTPIVGAAIAAAVIHYESAGVGTTTYHYEPTIIRGKRIQNEKLSPDEIAKIAQKLAKEFGEIAEEDIAALLSIFGNEEIVRYFLTHYEEFKTLTGGVWGESIVALFRKFIEFATEGKEFNAAEGIIALFFFLEGMNLVRSPSASWDFTDENDNSHWDVKSFTSDKSVQDMYNDILNEARQGERVMIDTTNMTEQQANELADRLAQSIDELTKANKGFDPAWFKWFPPRP